MSQRRSSSCELSALLEVVRLVEEEGYELGELAKGSHPLQLQELPDHIKNDSFASVPRPGSQRSTDSTEHTHAGKKATQSTATQQVSRLIPGGPCCSCGVTEAPQWRRPEPGTMLLCNRCGIHFMRYRRIPGPKKDQASKHSAPSSPVHMPGKRQATHMFLNPCDLSLDGSGLSVQRASSGPLNVTGDACVLLRATHVKRPPLSSGTSTGSVRMPLPHTTAGTQQATGPPVVNGLMPLGLGFTSASAQHTHIGMPALDQSSGLLSSLGTSHAPSFDWRLQVPYGSLPINYMNAFVQSGSAVGLPPIAGLPAPQLPPALHNQLSAPAAVRLASSSAPVQAALEPCEAVHGGMDEAEGGIEEQQGHCEEVLDTEMGDVSSFQPGSSQSQQEAASDPHSLPHSQTANIVPASQQDSTVHAVANVRLLGSEQPLPLPAHHPPSSLDMSLTKGPCQHSSRMGAAGPVTAESQEVPHHHAQQLL